MPRGQNKNKTAFKLGLIWLYEAVLFWELYSLPQGLGGLSTWVNSFPVLRELWGFFYLLFSSSSFSGLIGFLTCMSSWAFYHSLLLSTLPCEFQPPWTELWTPRDHWALSYFSELRPGNSLQAVSWDNHRVHFITLLSRITILCCLLSNIWKSLFHIFGQDFLVV